MCNTTIYDSMMGSGKSTSLIEYINTTDHPVLILVERLTEMQRFEADCPRLVAIQDDGTSAPLYNQLIAYAKAGKSMVSTHALMKRWDYNFLNHIKAKGYSLWIDEAVTGIISLLPIKQQDIQICLDNGTFVLDPTAEFDKVTLGAPMMTQYAKLESTILNKDVILFNDSSTEDRNNYFLIETMRKEIFTVFKDVNILTYLWESSTLRMYFDLHGMPYNLKSIVAGERTSYMDQGGDQHRDLLTVYNGKHNDFADYFSNKRKLQGLTHKWSKTPENRQLVKGHIRKIFYVYKKLGATPDTFCYSFHKEFRDRVHPPQVSKAQALKDYWSPKRSSMTPEAEAKLKQDVTWLPSTLRATNDWDHKQFMCFFNNTCPNPIIKRFLEDNGVEMDSDGYALGLLVQYIWRGCIRKGEPMHVYIPSKRMRHLLLKWLGYADSELH